MDDVTRASPPRPLLRVTHHALEFSIQCCDWHVNAEAPDVLSISTHEPSLPGANVHGAPSFVHTAGGSLALASAAADGARLHATSTMTVNAYFIRA
jgi:hypothetical protein